MAQNHALKKAARTLQEQNPGMPYTAALREAKKQHATTNTVQSEKKPQVPMRLARQARSILSTTFSPEQSLFIYVKDQVERLREEGLEELFEDELDDTFTINDNIYEYIFQTCSLIGETLEELSIYAYTEAEGASSLTELKLTELCWEIGRISQLIQHYYDAPVTGGHHIGNSAVYEHVLDSQEQEAMIQVILDVLVQETGTEYARDLDGFTGGENIFQLEFLALLARPFIGKHPQWTLEAYNQAASLWNDLDEMPLHPDDRAEENETAAPTMGVENDQTVFLKEYPVERWFGETSEDKNAVIFSEGKADMGSPSLFTFGDDGTNIMVRYNRKELGAAARVEHGLSAVLAKQGWQISEPDVSSDFSPIAYTEPQKQALCAQVETYFETATTKLQSAIGQLRKKSRVSFVPVLLIVKELDANYAVHMVRWAENPVLIRFRETVNELLTLTPGSNVHVLYIPTAYDDRPILLSDAARKNTAVLSVGNLDHEASLVKAGEEDTEGKSFSIDGMNPVYFRDPAKATPAKTIAVGDAQGAEREALTVLNLALAVSQVKSGFYRADFGRIAPDAGVGNVAEAETYLQPYRDNPAPMNTWAPKMAANMRWNRQYKAAGHRIGAELYFPYQKPELTAGDVMQFMSIKAGRGLRKYTVAASTDRFTMLTAGEGENAAYTIIDWERGVRGAHNNAVNGYRSQDAPQVLEALESGDAELSERNNVLLDIAAIVRGKERING